MLRNQAWKRPAAVSQARESRRTRGGDGGHGPEVHASEHAVRLLSGCTGCSTSCTDTLAVTVSNASTMNMTISRGGASQFTREMGARPRVM